MQISEGYDKQSQRDKDRMYGGKSEEPTEAEVPAHKYDSIELEEKLKRINQWYNYELAFQAENRQQMAMDCDYYDSIQWSEEDAQVLISRGQAPLVFNEIKSTIDWMIGTERRSRIDYKILPRRNGPEAAEDAENKTQLLKYLSDVNKSTFKRSDAFENCVKAGVGWLEVGVKGDPTEELLYTRSEDWRNIIYDSNSVERDGSDMRYLFRSRWIDEDIALAYFPDRKDIIQQAVTNNGAIDGDDEEFYYMGALVTPEGQDYRSVSQGRYQSFRGSGNSMPTRMRVKLKECWYKEPKLKRKFAGGEYDNQEVSESPEHMKAIEGGYSTYDKLELEVRCMIFCDAGVLYDGPSPYKHGRIPFVPIWCYRRTRDNAPYGQIRTLRDPQDDLNKRRSKAQWILSSNGVVMDEGAVDDIETLREEVSRPDYVIVKKPGKELRRERDIQLAQEHLNLMESDIMHIRNSGGVNNENLGRQTNASSGVALQERKESGSVVTTAPFDNLRFATQLVGEMELSNVEQFYTAEKVVRIVGERGGVRFKELNKIDDSGNVLNDITKFQADFVVSEQDYRSSLRQAMFESLFDIVSRLAQMNPQVALNLLDLVVEMADLPNKDELVTRIRKLNGQADPDKEETPEEVEARMQQDAAMKQEQDMAKQVAIETAKLQLKELKSKSNELDAKAIKTKIEAIYSSLQAAGTIATIPAAAPIADEILKGAGYEDAAVKANTEAISESAQVMQEKPPQIEMPAAAQGVRAGIQTPNIEGV